MSVKEKQFISRSIEKPDDLFYPMALYIKKFGNPRDKRLAALGHKKYRADGTLGVIVPGNKEVPWTLKNVSGNTIEMEKEEDVGSSDGGEQIAQERFQALLRKDLKEYRDLAQGAVEDVLNELAMGDEESAKYAADRKKKNCKRKATDAKNTDPDRFVSLSFFMGADDDETDEELVCQLLLHVRLELCDFVVVFA